ncbi:extracellular catalytic domain type 1 short-chain-length polyhydroxyalkanoate depolymerase [Sphingomonas xanthus]|uniref:Poly(3-hydroxybutyrate) depolymerase n=1 Tax=Sphingomonas xanthus TaxID=2594473 RepID=A0A516IQZ5_9SPHN|nr:PHB depolymerase family esterase [Sphingomonas xanthus]QDP19326.1 poly(3-hydroxybutyrate) depolymerase [Sphingomonas xanthus]
MARGFAIGTLILATIGAGVAAPAPAQRGPVERLAGPAVAPINAPGTYRFDFQHGGLTRRYMIHVPPGLPRGKAVPVLLALHGGGGNMEFQAKNYGLTQMADKTGFIVVFPNGHSRFRNGMLATWNAGACCGRAAEHKVDDVGFLTEVIDRVRRQLPVDRRRIYATGMSNGALMSYRLACERADLIRAIAPVAGTDNTLACNPSRPVPVIHFHARDDSHVPYGGGVGPDSLVKANFASVPATIAKWVRFNRAAPRPRTVLQVEGARCDLHGAGLGGAPVQLCLTDGGGHSWPGADPRGIRKQPSRAISANEQMWRFFQAL